MTTRSIYLIGASGSGKSTVAALVAARLGIPARDLDRLIAERAGATIAELFEREGEQRFRERESAMLRELAADPPAVIATGGGAPLRAENRAVMASGWVITLEGQPETLYARISAQAASTAPDAVRPLLASENPLERLRAIKAQRQPLYALADWTVHTDRLSPEQVAAEIVRAVALLEQAERREPDLGHQGGAG